MIGIRRPGLMHYVDRIKRGKSFAFVRYGEGEIKWMVPELPIKGSYKSFLGEHYDYVCQELIETVTSWHQSDRYIMAIQHLWHFKETGKLETVYRWFAANVPEAIRWAYAGVFRDATMKGRFYPMIAAIRSQPLPLVFVGPERIAPIVRRFKAKHIVTHPRWAYQRRQSYKEQILELGKPCFISFSVSFCAKWLIHQLWPEIGEHSHLIDFGSLWDGYCDIKKRPYHPKMTKKLIRQNLCSEK